MNIPSPRPGLVIRYGFLWSHESDDGREESSKDRPCAIVVATRRNGDEIQVIVAPITHSLPNDPGTSIPIPQDVCRRLGLDGDKHWFRVDELNRFTWPGFDLRPIPGTTSIEYGLLPKNLFEELRAKILERQKQLKARVPTNRD